MLIVAVLCSCCPDVVALALIGEAGQEGEGLRWDVEDEEEERTA